MRLPKGWASICAAEGINAAAPTKYVEQINQQGYLLPLSIQKRCSPAMAPSSFGRSKPDDAGVSCWTGPARKWCNMDGTRAPVYTPRTSRSTAAASMERSSEATVRLTTGCI